MHHQTNLFIYIVIHWHAILTQIAFARKQEKKELTSERGSECEREHTHSNAKCARLPISQISI